MMTTTERTEVEQLAALMSEAFKTRTREDGSTYDELRDGSPEWMSDVAREAHGDMFLPDDWRYAVIAAAVEALSEDEGTEASEFGDDQVDIYTGDRIAWLASHSDRTAYCDQAQEDGLAGDAGVVDLIGTGQYVEAVEVFEAVRVTLQAHAGELETSDGMSDEERGR